MLTVPNLLTILRIALVPVFVVFLWHKKFEWALGTFLLAGLSDGVDGFLARRFQQQTALGRLLDPVADKLLMIVAFIALAIPNVVVGENLPIPLWLTLSVLTRDALILAVAGVIFFTTDFRGFQPTLWGKASTVVQIVAVVYVLVAAAFPSLLNLYLPIVYFVVFLLALISGVHYGFFIAQSLQQNKVKSEI